MGKQKQAPQGAHDINTYMFVYHQSDLVTKIQQTSTEKEHNYVKNVHGADKFEERKILEY